MLELSMILLFVGFGLLIGTLFGFFGMGGSFLVTPALLVLGYPSKVAVGSGLAFVFGTSVIAALRHRDLGQVDYKLGVLMVAGMTAGLEVGKNVVLELEAMGLADQVIGVAYVLLLGTVGLIVLNDARTGGDSTREVPRIAEVLSRYQLRPTITLKGGTQVSVWITLAIALLVGTLSGFLGVGGGFLLMPSMMYVLGVPAAVAVGTDVFQITISGGVGAFLYAQIHAVDLPVVATLLAGSALGARVGSAATSIVDEDEIKVYFGLMLLAGSVAVASKKLGHAFDVGALNTLSIALIFGAALLVAGAILYTSVRNVRRGERPSEGHQVSGD